MESRIVPHGQAPSHEHEVPPQPRDAEENEDDKVYYGFGVFMGLPLADLKAMKESYMKKHALAVANGDIKMDSAMHGAPAPAAGESASYSRLPRREGDERYDRDSRNSHNGRESYEERDDEHHSDGSEDSYGQPKSHSLNFILH